MKTTGLTCKLICIGLILSFYFLTPCKAQEEEKEVTSDRKQADRYFRKLLYPEALKLYLEVAKYEPKDAKTNFRIGVCYLKTADKEKALQYLQKASKLGEKNEDMVDMNYCFGRAYHFLLDFDNAIKYYQTYLSTVDHEKDIQEVTEIKHLIEMCENGKSLVAQPVKVKIEHLDGDINSGYSDFSPIISADGKTLYFSSRRHIASQGNYNKDTDEYNEDVFVSYLRNDKWIPALPLNAINDVHDEAPVSLSWDGKDLFLYRTDRGYDYDLWEYRLDSAHALPVKMKKNINSGDIETGGCLSPDGERFYFCSDRKGGFGGMDIYYSTKQADGSWGHAINLGPIINTKYDEESPFLFNDGKTLYFSSEGHNSMGESDLFVSKLTDSSTWVQPHNLGYPVNTAEDEESITLTADGKTGYYSSMRADSYGEEDIYKLSFEEFPGINEQSILKQSTIARAAATTHSDSVRMAYAASPGTHVPQKGDVIEDKAHFEFNSTYITEYSRHKIDHVIATLKQHPAMKILVCGYASAMGTPEYNLKLSNERATVVMDYMVSQGISKDRLFAKAYGSENLVISGRDKRQNVINRRVEFVVMNNDNVVVEQQVVKKGAE